MYDSDHSGTIIGALVGIVIVAVLGFILCMHVEASEQVVSGIVYNTVDNKFISGNTDFSVRAGVDTYVSSSNESDYCLPPNSPYISIVNKAAADKSIKVIVTTKKAFALRAPWTCLNNVTVKEEK